MSGAKKKRASECRRHPWLDWHPRPHVNEVRRLLRASDSRGDFTEHTYAQPTIRFHGERPEGFRALAIALQARLPLDALRRISTINSGERTDAYWEMTFRASR